MKIIDTKPITIEQIARLISKTKKLRKEPERTYVTLEQYEQLERELGGRKGGGLRAEK